MPRQAASSGRGTKKPPVSNAARNQLIDCYDRGSNYKDFAKSMGINLKTASRIILDYIKTGKREALLKGGRCNVKVDDEMRAYLYEAINNNPSITLRKINEGCKVRATKENSALGLRLHRFPRNPHRRQLWVNAINRPDWIASDNDRICGLHFHSRYPVRNTASIDYVPTIFSSRPQDESNFVTEQRLKCFNTVNNSATRYPDNVIKLHICRK
uniref:THAP-type domain-containing protein n=1 Tax=Octopus bimaculoides TaxID=37653 RepID=A0A0L8GCF6_OCTBM